MQDQQRPGNTSSLRRRAERVAEAVRGAGGGATLSKSICETLHLASQVLQRSSSLDACGSILCLSPETFGSSENLPVVERRVLPQDSGGQQGELLQIRSGRLSAERRRKKDFGSNFETDPLRPAVVMVKLLGAPGRVEGKVDVYMRSSMQRL